MKYIGMSFLWWKDGVIVPIWIYRYMEIHVRISSVNNPTLARIQKDRRGGAIKMACKTCRKFFLMNYL